MQADSILFDLDGTLWDATEQVVRAWNEILIAKGYRFSDADMQGVMGLQLQEIGEKLFPELGEKERMALMSSCCDYECELLLRRGGVLFEGVERTLKTLSAKLPLFIVSNCQSGYIESFLEHHGLSSCFKDYQCSGTDGLPKGENIKKVIARNGLRQPVYVGDTQGDRNAAQLADIPFIFASYGFGEVTDYNFAIQKPEELLKLIAPAT